MTGLNACPTCRAARPANRTGTEHWCCSIACFRSFHSLDGPGASSLHDFGGPHPARDVLTDEREEPAGAGVLDPAPSHCQHCSANADGSGPGPMPLAEGWSHRAGGRQQRLSEGWITSSKPSEITKYTKFGAVQKVSDRGRTVITFDEQSLRRFYLYDVLLHELGHHVDRFGALKGAERYALWFAEFQHARLPGVGLGPPIMPS